MPQSEITLDVIARALSLPLPGYTAQERMATVPRTSNADFDHQGPAREGAVLLALMQVGDELVLPLTRRSERLNHHRGQISFPGGRRDPQDTTLWRTALREAREEIALPESSLHQLGQLSELFIAASHFVVQPFVGLVEGLPPLRPNPDEVAEILCLPLTLLLDDSAKHRETWQWRERPTLVPYYLLGDKIIWGATAMMLSELETLLRQALGLPDAGQS